MKTLDLSKLEVSFPHIYKAVILMWGSKELYTYVNNILLNTRDGARAGFPPEIAQLLLAILDQHYYDDGKFEIDWR